MKRKPMINSDFVCTVCTVCNGRMPLYRSSGKLRENGHIKDMWCPYCKTDRKFLEVKHGQYLELNGIIIYA